tara:strand:+ start:1884 stop:2240 length:357 start_codon:yes stop_codon:yes gene_type:complete
MASLARLKELYELTGSCNKVAELLSTQDNKVWPWSVSRRLKDAGVDVGLKATKTKGIGDKTHDDILMALIKSRSISAAARLLETDRAALFSWIGRRNYRIVPRLSVYNENGDKVKCLV